MLMELLPPYYENSPESKILQEAMESKLQHSRQAMVETLEQMNVDTATWGLSLWERLLGLETDATKQNDYRRSRIKSKLRGAGTTTAQMIQNLAESFSNGQVEVIERNGEYTFDIKFVGTIGIPPNMDDLTAAIEEVKPAHLAYTFIILYRIWQQLKTKTWGELKIHAWADIREGDI